MNRYDEIYDIRLARRNETEAVMNYIAEDWKKGHLMSTNKTLFEHEFYTSEKEFLNIIIAVRKDNGKIDGMLGFIPSSRNETPDLWGSIWKIREGSVMFLGNELMKRLLLIVPHRNFAAIGINMTTTGKLVNRTMGYYIGRLKHWYVLNKNIDSFKIAIINNRKEIEVKNRECFVRETETIEDVDKFFNYENFTSSAPYKDRWYIKRRYFDYPINKYKVYMIGKKNVDALMITRQISVLDTNVLRIVDFIGNSKRIADIGYYLAKLIKENKCEYADFYENGFDDSDLEQAGFIERKENDANIIPNYFSPFEQKNVEIYFHSPVSNYIFCKADGDQDRPN